MTVVHSPADKLGCDLADDSGGRSPVSLCQGPGVVGERGRGRRAVVGGAAPISKLSSVEGAAAGAAPGEARAVRGRAADAVGGRRRSGGPSAGAGETDSIKTS